MKIKNYISGFAAGLFLFGVGEAVASDYSGSFKTQHYRISASSQQPRTMTVGPFDDLPKKLEDFLKEKKTEQRQPKDYIGNVCKPDKEPWDPECQLMEIALVQRDGTYKRYITDLDISGPIVMTIPTNYPVIDPENPQPKDPCPTRPRIPYMCADEVASVPGNPPNDVPGENGGLPPGGGGSPGRPKYMRNPHNPLGIIFSPLDGD